MTQEDKELLLLLLKDLCARLPYGVKVFHPDYDEPQTLDTIFNFNAVLNGGIHCDVDDITERPKELIYCKPYLRPMSSMTEEEIKEYNEYLFHGASIGLMSNTETANELIDWLNKKMFDYRCLIPMGLAIAVTENNNPYKD